MSNEQWTMPDWMKPFAPLIGGDISYIEEMMNDRSLIQVNAPRALIAVEMKGKVSMLTRLRNAHALGQYDHHRVC